MYIIIQTGYRLVVFLMVLLICFIFPYSSYTQEVTSDTNEVYIIIDDEDETNEINIEQSTSFPNTNYISNRTNSIIMHKTNKNQTDTRRKLEKVDIQGINIFKPIKIAVSIEFGGGDIFSSYFSYYYKRFNFLIGPGFTYDELKMDGVNYKIKVFSFYGYAGYNVLMYKKFLINAGIKPGYNYIFADNTQKGSLFSLSLNTIFSIKNHFFADISLPMIFGNNNTSFILQFGFGYKIKIKN